MTVTKPDAIMANSRHQRIQTVLALTNSSAPSRDSSRPNPESLIPADEVFRDLETEANEQQEAADQRHERQHAPQSMPGALREDQLDEVDISAYVDKGD